MEALKESIQIPKLENQKLEEIRQMLLKGTRLKQLIELSRAVHAEMNALISVARTAVPGLVGSTLYVTTYPCHNCAKHIIDAGIKRVVFVEPYVKSLAQRLHADAINNPLEDYNNNKVSFDNYGGVSAERYSHFFSVHRERKKDGKFIRKSLEKDMLLPLGAQEIDNLKKRLMQFKEWFEKKSQCQADVNDNSRQVSAIATNEGVVEVCSDCVKKNSWPCSLAQCSIELVTR